jgi:chorismate mutase
VSAAGGAGPGAGGRGVAALRAEIEAVDREVVGLVARRLELARAVGARKRDDAAATLDPGREAAVVRRAVEAGREHGLPEEPVRQLFWTLIGLCRAKQLEDG